MKKAQYAMYDYFITFGLVIVIALIVWFAIGKDPFDYQRNRELTQNLSISICGDYGYFYGEQRADYILCYAVEQIDQRNITIPVYIWVDWELERNKSGLWMENG